MRAVIRQAALRPTGLPILLEGHSLMALPDSDLDAFTAEAFAVAANASEISPFDVNAPADDDRRQEHQRNNERFQ